MSEESRTPHLVELTRQAVEAGTRRDFDALMSFYSPDAVWDLSPLGVGTFEGRAAIRRFVGSTGDTQLRQAWVQVWVGAMMVRQMSYLDPDEARAAAERLAQERG